MRAKPWTRPRLPRGQVRIQWTLADQKGSAKLTVPASIARLISSEAVFRCELTNDGILFRYLSGQQPASVGLPAWLNGRES